MLLSAHDTSKEIFAIIVSTINNLVLPRGAALAAWCNAAFQSQSSPHTPILPYQHFPPGALAAVGPHGAEPCLPPNRSQDWNLRFEQSRAHQRWHHKPRDLFRARHSSCWAVLAQGSCPSRDCSGFPQRFPAQSPSPGPEGAAAE